MPRVIFKFDKESDLWNNWHKSNLKKLYGAELKLDDKIIKICKGKKFEDCRDELSEYLHEIHNSPLMRLSLESAEKSWRLIENEFFTRMDRIMKNNFSKDITAYITTVKICPYNPKEPSFMFPFFSPLPNILKSCGHEIMHLYFHEFYWNFVKDKIGEKNTSNLKEALTVLLNIEFKDLWFVEDSGYKDHEKLREFIVKHWKKEKDFKKLLSECIKYLTKM